MTFDVHKFALAASLSALIVFGFLHTAMWFMHSGSMMNMMRGNREMMSQMFTPMGFLIRLTWIFVLVYLGAALFAWMYNKLVKQK